MTQLRIYLAGTGHDPRFATTMIADNLRAHDFDVVSHWHDPGVWKPGQDRSIAEGVVIATSNYADLDKADVVLVVVPAQEHHLRGAHTECGYALAKKKRIVVWGGPRSLNTMVQADKCTFAPDWWRLLDVLDDLVDSVSLDAEVERAKAEFLQDKGAHERFPRAYSTRWPGAADRFRRYLIGEGYVVRSDPDPVAPETFERVTIEGKRSVG